MVDSPGEGSERRFGAIAKSCADQANAKPVREIFEWYRGGSFFYSPYILATFCHALLEFIHQGG